MWLKAQDGVLINLDHVARVRAFPASPDGVSTGYPCILAHDVLGSHVILQCASPEESDNAMKRLTDCMQMCWDNTVIDAVLDLADATLDKEPSVDFADLPRLSDEQIAAIGAISDEQIADIGATATDSEDSDAS